MSMATKNPASFVKAGFSIESEVYTASKNGTGVDCRGFDHALVVMNFGTVSSGSDGTIKIQESSDDASADAYADVTGASYTVTGTEDDSVKLAEVRLHGRERYLRAVYTEGSTGNSVAVSVAILPVGPQDQANDQSTTYSFSV